MSAYTYIYGYHTVKVVIKRTPWRVMQLVLPLPDQHSKPLADISALAKRYDIPIDTVNKNQLQRLIGTVNHQNIVAKCKAATPLITKDLINLLDHLCHKPLLLLLDGVQDPHNLGACLRCADAFGVDAVIIPKDKAVGITPTVSKVACGAAQIVPLITVCNLAQTMAMLKKRNIWLYGTKAMASQSLYHTDFTQASALVLGSEGKGLRRLTAKHCDALVYIPMQGTISSLNVAVATGVSLSEAVRQRLQAKT